MTTVVLVALAFFNVTSADQFCATQERAHARQVASLGQTYAYMLDLDKRELRLTINRFLIALLPQTEARARFDDAPGICDQFGLGLPEPDPVVPDRPPGVDKLYREFTSGGIGSVQTR